MNHILFQKIQEIIESHSGYEIGKKLGVNPSYFSRFKRGEYDVKNMRLEMIIQLLDAYADVSIKLKSE